MSATVVIKAIASAIAYFVRGIVLVYLGMLLFGAQPALAQIASPVSVFVLEDVQGVFTPEDVLGAPDSFAFTPVNNKRNFGVSRSVFWFKLDLSATPAKRQIVLEIGYPLLDIVDVYTREDAHWARLELGDTRPISNREIVHHNFLKILDMPAGESRTVFLRVRSEGPVIVPLEVWEMAAFHQQDYFQTLLEGLYFGVLLALILFNLFVYLSIHSRSYLYYVGYLSFITLFLLSMEGLVVSYILPSSPLFTSRLPFISLYLALIVAFKFTASINNTKRFAPGLLRIFSLYSLFLSAVLLVGLFLGVRFFSLVTPYLTMTAIVLYIHAIVRGIRANYRPSYFVGFAFLMLVPGAVLYVLRTVGMIDTGNWPEYLFKTGVALEALLLSLVLAYRVRYAQTRLKQVQQDALLERQGFSQKMIEIRDQELQQLAMELHDGLGQNLLAIKNKLSRVLRPEKEESRKLEIIRDTQNIAQSTIDDVRRISHQLHPHILDRLGLKEAIIQVAGDGVDKAETVVKCQIEDINFVKNSPIALHLYRIVQEAVKNCLIHSSAVRLEISLRHEGENLHLCIEDYPGQLNAPWLESVEYSQSFGLSNILDRVELLRGNAVFSHNDLGGFRIEITVPFLR